MLAISICFTTSVFAQQKAANLPAKPAPNVPPPGQQQILIKTIFAYEKELGLTQDQTKSLKDILSGFQNYLNDKRKDINERRTALSDLIVKKADMKVIRAALEQISAIQIDISCTDVETARKVEGVLTPAQLEKWKAIQEQARKEAEQAIKQAQEKQASQQPKTGK